jgi:hypothetical protein
VNLRNETILEIYREALDRRRWKTRFGRRYGSDVKETTWWLRFLTNIYNINGQLNKFYEMNDTLLLLKTRLYNRDSMGQSSLKLLKTKRRLLYLKTQSVPRSKHFSSRL